MSLPLHDWQFWVVTVIFLAAAYWIARPFLPWGPGRRKKQRRATLTVSGKAVGRTK